MKNYPYPYPIKWCGDVFRTSVGKNKHLDKHADNTENVCLQFGGEYDFKKHRWLVFSLIFLTDSLTSFTQNGTQNEAICF